MHPHPHPNQKLLQNIENIRAEAAHQLSNDKETFE